MLIRGGEGGLSREGAQWCPRRKNMGPLVLVRSLFPHSGTIILITEGVLYLEERQDSFKLLVT